MVAVVEVPTSSASALKVILNGRTWAMVGREKGKCFYILTEFDNTLWSDCMVFCAFEISSMKNSTKEVASRTKYVSKTNGKI